MKSSEVTKKENFVSRLVSVLTERSVLKDFREIGVLIRYEFKRIILSTKFFLSLSLVLLPAIIFLNSISSEYEAIILDFGVEAFQQTSADGYVIIGQFLLQMMGLMLVLDSFGKVANDSMRRYYALPIRKINVYRAHFITILIGISITGLLSMLIFDLILWIWTGISLSFILMLKAFLMTILGAVLAVAISLLFVMLAHFFGFSSSIAIIPTLFLFYIIPFLVNFVTAFVFTIPSAYEWTFMYHLTNITKSFLKTEVIEKILIRNSLLIVGITAFSTEFIAKVLYLNKEY